MDLLTGFIMGIIRVTIWVIRVINLLTKSPDPPSGVQISPRIPVVHINGTWPKRLKARRIVESQYTKGSAQWLIHVSALSSGST